MADESGIVTATAALRNLLPYAGRSPSSRRSKIRLEYGIIQLTAIGIIFRSEIAVLLGCHSAYLLLAPHIRLPLSSVVVAGVMGAILGLGLAVPIDTFFWRSNKLLWSELDGFIYNFVEGRSKDWGVEPWSFYFTSALPRLLVNPLVYQVCIPYAVLTSIIRQPTLDILLPNLAFVALYSFQPHKEWRFIIYVLPPLLAVAGAGASWIWTRRAKTIIYRVLALTLVASTLASFAASWAMLAVSSLNYPGAQALNRFHQLSVNESGSIVVHMDTLTCMTGVTRFLERPDHLAADHEGKPKQKPLWIYDKTEDEDALLDPFFWEKMDYALAEKPERVPGQWLVLDTVHSFLGIGLVKLPESDLPDLEGTLNVALEETERLFGLSKQAARAKRWDPTLGRSLRTLGSHTYNAAQGFLARRLTRGWWVRVKMEPRLSILKKEARSMEDAIINEPPARSESEFESSSRMEESR